MSPDPLAGARALLPAEQISAAGVFAVQDRALVTGLLGADRAAAAVEGLVRPDQSLAPYLPWIPVPFLVAVSAESIHIMDWRADVGTAMELARFARAGTAVTVESAGRARRLTLTDTRSGYRLPLTTTTSRLSPYGGGARTVLDALAPAQVLAPARESSLPDPR